MDKLGYKGWKKSVHTLYSCRIVNAMLREERRRRCVEEWLTKETCAVVRQQRITINGKLSIQIAHNEKQHQYFSSAIGENKQRNSI